MTEQDKVEIHFDYLAENYTWQKTMKSLMLAEVKYFVKNQTLIHVWEFIRCVSFHDIT